MNNSILYLGVILFVGSVTAFVQFENDVEYEFKFKSKFDLSPDYLSGRQLVNATLLVRKFGTDGSSLIVCIKDSEATGKNIDSESKSNIEGVFGVKRNSDGAITHIISKSTEAKEVLTKKSIVAMLTDDFSFFNNYITNPAARTTEHRVTQAIGRCDSDVTATTDVSSGLSKVLAQSEKRKCNVDPLILKAGQFLLQGTTKQLGRIKDDSNFGTSIIFDTKSKRMLEVSKFTFLNVVVAGLEVQARHNMILDYVGKHPVTSETNFEKPYYPFSSDDIDNFIREQEVEGN